MSETNYCPFCGSANEAHSDFCGNCGASLSDKPTTPAAQPPPPPPPMGAPPPQPGTQTYPTTPAQPPTNYAQTALILAIVGIFCCICLNFASLSYLNKARHHAENPSAINTARIVNIIAIILWIAGIIVSVISNFFWF